MFRRSKGATPRFTTVVQHKAQRGRLWITALMGGLLVAGGWQSLHWLTAPEQWPLRQISIVGQPSQMSESALTSLLQDQLGRNLLSLDLAELQQRLLAESWIAAAELRREWPDRLYVQLQARQAVAYWGESALLDTEAQIFHPTDLPEGKPWPRLYGAAHQAPELLNAYRLFSQPLSPLGLVIETLHWDDYGNRRFTLPSGITVELGSRDGLTRLQRFVTLYPDVLQPYLSELAVVDLRYPDGAALRWIEWSDDPSLPTDGHLIFERLRQWAVR